MTPSGRNKKPAAPCGAAGFSTLFSLPEKEMNFAPPFFSFSSLRKKRMGAQGFLAEKEKNGFKKKAGDRGVPYEFYRSSGGDRRGGRCPPVGLPVICYANATAPYEGEASRGGIIGRARPWPVRGRGQAGRDRTWASCRSGCRASRAMTSSMSMPSTRRLMPCRLPLQPPVKTTSFDLAAVQLNVDAAGAGALGTIIKFHGKIPFYSVRSQTAEFT